MKDRSIETGPTPEFSLRVSIATLSLVTFPDPADGNNLLALEHKATVLHEQGEKQVVVKAQPFGGAIRILDLNRLADVIGGFRFDSEQSRKEQDFRIFISPSRWETLREFCLEHLHQGSSPVLEIAPERELEEEFEDALEIQLRPDQYTLQMAGLVVENEPAMTANRRGSGSPTVRIYRVDEVHIQDPALSRLMIDNSAAHPPQALKQLALADFETGQGRANAVLVASLDAVRAAFLNAPLERRGERLTFAGTVLDGNVAATLNDVPIPKYQRLF